MNRKASPDPMLILPGGHQMRFWVVGPGGEQASFVSLRRKDAEVATILPAGDYAATVVLRRGTGNEAKHVTSGPVPVQISGVTHTPETALQTARAYLEANKADLSRYDMSKPEEIQEIQIQGQKGWRVSWKQKNSTGKGGQLLVIVSESGKCEQRWGE